MIGHEKISTGDDNMNTGLDTAPKKRKVLAKVSKTTSKKPIMPPNQVIINYLRYHYYSRDSNNI